MRIKKFFADNYREALDQVKRQVGEDALILDTRPVERIPGNGTGVEIIVALEEEKSSIRTEAPEKDYIEFPVENLVDEAKDHSLRPLLLTLFSQTERGRFLGLKDHQMEIYSQLVDNGVDERLVSKILQKSEKDHLNVPTGIEAQRGRLIDMIKKAIQCAGPIELVEGGPRVVALVGPTGVGKTTTIAKLAADFAYRQGKKVALISLDAFRIGAIDQLRLYGEIMQVPVDLANSVADFESLLLQHSNKDIIFVDTMGRSHKDENYTGELKRYFSRVKHLEKHLVLSLASDERLFDKYFQQFSSLGIDRLIFSKLDEGLKFGSLLNFSLRTRIPLSYYTSGQRVPEDIEVANKDTLIRLIFN
jgi:flagellar biosynthesis protein FlhF